METVKKKQIAVRLSSELLEQVDKLAKRESRNRSNMIEYLLRCALKKAGEK
jgi:hypothetical protein